MTNMIIQHSAAHDRAQAEKANGEMKRINEESESHLAFIRSEFTERFKHLFPALAELGITWEAKMQDRRYQHLGSYIQFNRGGEHIRMDFSSRDKYRYEFVRHSPHEQRYGSMTFDKWDDDRFAKFITDGFGIETT